MPIKIVIIGERTHIIKIQKKQIVWSPNFINKIFLVELNSLILYTLFILNKNTKESTFLTFFKFYKRHVSIMPLSLSNLALKYKYQEIEVTVINIAGESTIKIILIIQIIIFVAIQSSYP